MHNPAHPPPTPSLTWIGLPAVLALFLALATLQSLATRLQWGPDEPAHIIYVRSLAMDARLPALTHTEPDDAYLPGAARSHQAHHPPLYYALAALAWRAFSSRPDQTVTYYDADTGRTETYQVPGPVRPVRLLSVLLGAAALLFAWAAARTIFPDRPHLPLAAAALAAFTPMFTYVNGVISNDPLLILLFSATAWQWARLLRFGARPKGLLLLALLVGLAINTKETALALLPLSALVLALAPGAPSWRRRLLDIAAFAALALALGAWWYAHKWSLHGKPFVYPYFTPLLGLPEDQRNLLLAVLPGRVFIFTFLPLDVVQDHINAPLTSRLFAALAVLSVGGLLLAFLRGGKHPIPRYQTHSLLLWLAAAALVLLGLLRNVLFIDWRMGPHGGRYLMCVLPLLAIASARGLSALFGDGRAAKIALALISLLLLAVNIHTIHATAAAYQTLPLFR